MKNILVILLSSLLVLFVVAYIFNGGQNSNFTFGYFLDFVQSTKMQTFSFDFLQDFAITDNWGVFNFFRDFLNVFIDILNLLMFLVQNLLNVLAFVVSFFNRFFVGVLPTA